VPRLTDAQLEARRELVADAYERGQTLQEIADAHELTYGMVYRDLKARGIASRPRGPRPSGTIPLEARRDLVADEYVRLQRTIDEIANAHGLPRGTVAHDLKVRGIGRRPRGWRPDTTISEESRRRISEGARAWSKSDQGRERLTDPAALERLQDGLRGYRTEVEREVERVKAERGAFDTDELLKRLLSARLPRSDGAIGEYVRAGLIEPERGLGFAKPRLFTEASAGKLIAGLRAYPDGRLTRFNATTSEAARWRIEWTEKRHGGVAGQRITGRVAGQLAEEDGKKVGRPGMKRQDGSQLSAEELEQVVELLAAPGWSQGRIAIRFGVSRDQVKRYAASVKKLGETPLTAA
jgi:transposase-like protein